METTLVSAIEVLTSNPRAGRRFEPIQERALHKDALRSVEDLRGASRGLIVVPEFAGPIGVPDFTAYVGDIGRVRSRQALQVPAVVNEWETGIVSAMHVLSPSSAHAIAHRLNWPPETVADRLRRLAKQGVITEVSPGRFIRPESLEPGGRLYAIEAKVDDWRAALRQVRTYKVWADGYVLVMGQLSRRTEERLLTEVKRDRGGLMVSGRWVSRPRLDPPAPGRRLQAWELFAAATQEGLSDPSLTLGIHA